MSEAPQKRRGGGPRGKRGEFKLLPARVDEARTKFLAAQAAVRLCVTGGEIAPDLAGDRLVSSWARLEHALSVYVAVVVLEAPKRVLAAAIEADPSNVRRWVRFVEAWRGAPLVDRALRQIETTLPRSF